MLHWQKAVPHGTKLAEQREQEQRTTSARTFASRSLLPAARGGHRVSVFQYRTHENEPLSCTLGACSVIKQLPH